VGGCWGLGLPVLMVLVELAVLAVLAVLANRWLYSAVVCRVGAHAGLKHCPRPVGPACRPCLYPTSV
jgi:hypothetical protein